MTTASTAEEPMILRDFLCERCNTRFEDLVARDALTTPCACGAVAPAVPSGGRSFTTIVATTRTSKKYKAGYMHSHGDRPRTKVQVQGGITSGE